MRVCLKNWHCEPYHFTVQHLKQDDANKRKSSDWAPQMASKEKERCWERRLPISGNEEGVWEDASGERGSFLWTRWIFNNPTGNLLLSGPVHQIRKLFPVLFRQRQFTVHIFVEKEKERVRFEGLFPFVVLCCTFWSCVFQLLPGTKNTISWSSLTSPLFLFTPSLGRVRRPCRGQEKFFPPVLQRCYGCSFDAQEIIHTGHDMLVLFLFFFFWRERCLPKVSWKSNPAAPGLANQVWPFKSALYELLSTCIHFLESWESSLVHNLKNGLFSRRWLHLVFCSWVTWSYRSRYPASMTCGESCSHLLGKLEFHALNLTTIC